MRERGLRGWTTSNHSESFVNSKCVNPFQNKSIEDIMTPTKSYVFFLHWPSDSIEEVYSLWADFSNFFSKFLFLMMRKEVVLGLYFKSDLYSKCKSIEGNPNEGLVTKKTVKTINEKRVVGENFFQGWATRTKETLLSFQDQYSSVTRV